MQENEKKVGFIFLSHNITYQMMMQNKQKTHRQILVNITDHGK